MIEIYHKNNLLSKMLEIENRSCYYLTLIGQGDGVDREVENEERICFCTVALLLYIALNKEVSHVKSK